MHHTGARDPYASASPVLPSDRQLSQHFVDSLEGLADLIRPPPDLDPRSGGGGGGGIPDPDPDPNHPGPAAGGQAADPGPDLDPLDASGSGSGSALLSTLDRALHTLDRVMLGSPEPSSAGPLNSRKRKGATSLGSQPK
jgi:hypothetical protein